MSNKRIEDLFAADLLPAAPQSVQPQIEGPGWVLPPAGAKPTGKFLTRPQRVEPAVRAQVERDLLEMAQLNPAVAEVLGVAGGMPPPPPLVAPQLEADNEIALSDLLASPYAYLSGPAGTGKTYLARQIIETEPGAQLCATTGIAAVNLGDAATINSILRYFDTRSLVQSYTSGQLMYQLRRLRKSGLTRLVLDETSMLDGDQLTVLVRAIDEVNHTRSYDEDTSEYVDDPRFKSRGDLGLLLVGDFAQLPPVKAPFAFESDEWARFADHTFKLQRIRRQGDQAFVRALMAVRKGQPAAAVDVLEPRFVSQMDIDFPGTTIVATNDAVDRVNRLRHDKVKGEMLTFKATRSGDQETEWVKQIPDQVDVKVGALVMILANKTYPKLDPDEPPSYQYVNGDLGIVQGKAPGGGCQVQLQRDGRSVTVQFALREKKEPTGKKNPAWEIKGSITYMPLRLAYATTVHKSQGLSLDHVQVSIVEWMFGKPGMTYVALSRARTLEGLRIVGNPKMFLGKCAVDKKVEGWL